MGTRAQEWRTGSTGVEDWEHSCGGPRAQERSCSGLGNMLFPIRAGRVVCSSLNVKPSCTVTLSLSINRMSKMETVHFSGLGLLRKTSMVHAVTGDHIGVCGLCYCSQQCWCLWSCSSWGLCWYLQSVLQPKIML